MRLSVFIFMTFFFETAWSRAYRTPVIPAPHTGVKIFVPYTFGTHEGEAKLFTGNIYLDVAEPEKSKGEFSVPINSLSTNNDERDCHMQEALGLDYAQSDYPKEHVCNETNNLPSTGKNAVKYPGINLKIFSLKSLDSTKVISAEKETDIEVDGEWSIHGKSQRLIFPLKIMPEGQNFRVKGEMPFSLKNYDIEIKKSKVLFFNISVKDNVKVEFNLLLEPELL